MFAFKHWVKRKQVWCFPFLYKWQIKQQAQDRKRNQPTSSQLCHQQHIPKGTCCEKTELRFRRPWILQNNEQQSKWKKNVNVPSLPLHWQTTMLSKTRLDAKYVLPHISRTFRGLKWTSIVIGPQQIWNKCMIGLSDFPRLLWLLSFLLLFAQQHTMLGSG